MEHGFTEQMVSDQIILLIVQDNIDIAAETIEKAAMDRAVLDVDDGFAPSYEARRRHREVSLSRRICALLCHWLTILLGEAHSTFLGPCCTPICVPYLPA